MEPRRESEFVPLLEDYGHGDKTSQEPEDEKPAKGFHFVSWPVGMSFDINYILGVGVLSIPISFYNGGPALGVLFLLFVTLVSYVLSMI
ncbi:MAG: hypothetical protein Q8P67_06345 [archaeon]|nr:hypothetical protein [archaeon]